MADDPKLVEAVARAIFLDDEEYQHGSNQPGAWGTTSKGSRGYYSNLARIALAAINASGTHWVAPAEPTERMIEVGHMQCRRDELSQYDRCRQLSCNGPTHWP